MDPLLNPYRPGAGAPPPTLAGREGELEAIETLLGRLSHGRGERSIVITGLRGVGKTALLWVATALLFHYSSLAALVAAVAGAALAALWSDKATALLVAGIALLIILRHHANIRRLLAGTESRISLGKG